MPWRGEFGQYSGFLHAGLIGALIDTACGFAAVTVAGPGVLAAHFSQNCLRPAQGEQFIARARVVRAGKTQVFTACELFTVAAQEEKLVATGEALLGFIKASVQACIREPLRPHRHGRWPLPATASGTPAITRLIAKGTQVPWARSRHGTGTPHRVLNRDRR